MALQRESVFRYAVPNPDTRLIEKAMAFAVLSFTISLVTIWLFGVLPPWILGLIYLVYVMSVVGTVALTSFTMKRNHVVVTPERLVFKRLLDTREIAWQDVVSVGLGKREPANFIERLLRGESDLLCTKIELRYRRLGLTIPGTNMVALYLRDGEGFVQEEQQYLTPVAG